ncbi:death domain-containing protein CRADD [Biomphalaria pfeifferi]|uniref:Death domain-containing protein CRADD n=1 Tax=Biomphalaria pfeifferi TaxID=112525 RepID=A0AAD8BWH4_BIOPF|nr:death domain-containing protein CRADD [Biomphalaria pfeifferi]
MQKGKLRQADEDSIRKNYVDLKENIEARELVDYLYQYKVISEVDKELIQEGKSKSERNEHLLQTLLNSGPGDAFRIFIQALIKMKYNHLKLVQEYLSQDVENTEPFSTSANDIPDATPLRQINIIS